MSETADPKAQLQAECDRLHAEQANLAIKIDRLNAELQGICAEYGKLKGFLSRLLKIMDEK